jgi:hypothetical protein
MASFQGFYSTSWDWLSAAGKLLRVVSLVLLVPLFPAFERLFSRKIIIIND